MADFLINYEHKAREIEAVCLIKVELERRGYSVELSCTYDEDRIRGRQRRKAKVILASALYNDACLYAFVYSIAGFCKKVVNLQWEQALTNQDESDPSFYQNPKGYCADALHLCWGEEPRTRLLRSGVARDRAIVVGPVQMDLLRPEFNEYYFNKEKLAERFDLDATKEWILFISSFTFVNMSEEEYEAEMKCMGMRLDEFRRLSIISKINIINWLKEAIRRWPGKIFIYRPHPSENEDPALLEMESMYNNFRVIKELSVKQWIKCSNKILTWYSTSAAEVYYSRKNLTILRPVEIPYEWDVSIFRNSQMISDIDHFLQDIEKDDGRFPLNKSIINDYFLVQDNTPAYMRICDVLEKVINSNDYDMRKHRLFIFIYIHSLQIRHRLLFIIKEKLAGNKYEKILMNNRFLIKKMKKYIAVMNRLRRDRNKNQASEKEIADIISKIRKIVYAGEPS